MEQQPGSRLTVNSTSPHGPVETSSPIHLVLPADSVHFATLKAGQQVLLHGKIYTARDAAHLRFITLLEQGQPLPISLSGETIFYTGPSPTPPGQIIGSCGPTTASRMDRFTPPLLNLGLKGMIGKGPRSAEVIESMKTNQGVYFYAFGGCGALYAQRIRSREVVCFEDLGPEAVHLLEVANFPVVVGIDSLGNSVFS